MNIINKILEDTILEKKESITSLIHILLEKVLRIKKEPNIIFDSKTTSHYDTINNSIYINTGESIYKNKSIFNISHECFHVSQKESGLDLKYDDAGRKIIEWECSEYGYNYEFEVDASAFALAFTNYYIYYVEELDYKYPFGISNDAKSKYPSLVEKEIEIKRKANDYYNKYISKFKEYTDDIKIIKHKRIVCK